MVISVLRKSALHGLQLVYVIATTLSSNVLSHLIWSSTWFIKTALERLTFMIIPLFEIHCIIGSLMWREKIHSPC